MNKGTVIAAVGFFILGWFLGSEVTTREHGEAEERRERARAYSEKLRKEREKRHG